MVTTIRLADAAIRCLQTLMFTGVRYPESVCTALLRRRRPRLFSRRRFASVISSRCFAAIFVYVDYMQRCDAARVPCRSHCCFMRRFDDAADAVRRAVCAQCSPARCTPFCLFCCCYTKSRRQRCCQPRLHARIRWRTRGCRRRVIPTSATCRMICYGKIR